MILLLLEVRAFWLGYGSATLVLAISQFVTNKRKQ